MWGCHIDRHEVGVRLNATVHWYTRYWAIHVPQRSCILLFCVFYGAFAFIFLLEMEHYFSSLNHIAAYHFFLSKCSFYLKYHLQATDLNQFTGDETCEILTCCCLEIRWNNLGTARKVGAVENCFCY
jgi:hypothetical protein